MPLPKLPQLDSLDDDYELEEIEDEYEELEEITEENLIEELPALEEEYMPPPPPPVEEETYIPPAPDYEDEEPINLGQKKQLKEDLPKKSKKKKDFNIPKLSFNPKMLKTIITAVLALVIIVAVFVVGKSFLSGSKQTKSSEKAVSQSSDIEITSRTIEDGKYKLEVSSNKDTNVEYIESAFLNDGNLVKCIVFNPYIDKGTNIVELDDCDNALVDSEVKEYLDNIKEAE